MEKVSGTSVHLLLMRVCCWGERLCLGMKSQGKDRRWHSQTVPSQGSFAEGCSVPRDTWAQGFQLCFLVSEGMSFPARARARCQGILSIFLPSFPPSLDSRDAWSFSERCKTARTLLRARQLGLQAAFWLCKPGISGELWLPSSLCKLGW